MNTLGTITLLILGVVSLASAPAAGAGSTEKGLEAEVVSYLRTSYPWPEIEMSNFSVAPASSAGVPEKIIVEKGMPGKTVFIIEFSGGKKAKATADVKAFDRVVLSKRAFAKGYEITEEDLYAPLVEVSKIPKGAAGSVDAVKGKTLKRPVIANSAITDDMLSDSPMLKKGRPVVLLMESRGFTITALGELRENGYVGGYVKTQNFSSKKTVRGLLMDENTVKVEF